MQSKAMRDDAVKIARLNDMYGDLTDYIEELEASLEMFTATLKHYACEKDCCECNPSERGKASWCGWPALEALASITTSKGTDL